ncbi:hypothetical protein BAUCODRAFT_38026 [Baudoinia panamericana UAMH 10762]|uniref:Kinesin-like protein n=1 Tax=Baudoinia panamericana (strain UAMH 10762) TaxID=717646 RepID=M2MNT0_BAUPA|nr:uncharacterized protein BAUCODRAFT_38026 [Baudoinia panamericana UAMH 10762]EMC93108.1 hypothetical protein BAUCODRAFT_38026 [Baudoinia panamericana UAMH 10762]
MDNHKPTTSLFDVYLRLRPSSAVDRERFLDVEREKQHTDEPYAPTHITIHPPANDNRKRAVEKFAFTTVFEEHVGQREIFESTGILPLVEGVLGGNGKERRDGLVATLGVTGSGKTHTILGSKSERGITQLTLDILFKRVEAGLVDIETSHVAIQSLCSADVSEAHLITAAQFFDSVYPGDSGGFSRATTPALETSFLSLPASKRHLPRVSTFPQYPPIDDISLDMETNAEYAIIISMYEVYNDRIYDLLTAASSTTKTPQKRRALLFKPTEASPDRKVVAGLCKVICSSLAEALMVLETGLQGRRVADTNSNAVSSRSHGFFCMEVKKRRRSSQALPISSPWTSSTLTIVDLAGSERARTAKTAGATLAEAGKINESLMYLGQCMQMQSDNARNSLAPGAVEKMVPFRQCKLTELLFSNSFASNGGGRSGQQQQKAVMIVTADPLGDFNATSQILRYSALAREVTVPRIPSVTSTILSGTGAVALKASGCTTPAALQGELEQALADISRLREELEVTQLLLEEETRRRQDAENAWQAAEGRMEEIEAEVREEVWTEMEAKLALEQRRWRAARDAEMDAQDEHLDRKLELLTHQLSVYEDDTADKENISDSQLPSDKEAGKERVQVRGIGGDLTPKYAELEEENVRLREEVALMRRERESVRSPSKKIRVLKPSRRWQGSGIGVEDV